jgi:hypothetical protein
VQFPKQKPTDDYPDATNLPRDPKPADDSKQQAKPDAASPDASQPAAAPTPAPQPPPGQPN